MTRGNQRELARAKNLKKTQCQAKERDKPDGISLQNIKLQDAEIMRRKQAEAEAKKTINPNTGNAQSVSKPKK